MRPLPASWLLAAFVASFSSPLLGAVPATSLGVDEALRGEPVLAAALGGVKVPVTGLSLFVRLAVGREEIESEPGQFAFEALDARIALYKARGIPILIDLGQLPAALGDAEGWKRYVTAVARRYAGQIKGYQFGTDLAGNSRPEPKDYAFFVKLTTVQIRSADERAFVALGGLRLTDAAWQEALYREDVAAYLDAVALAATPLPEPAALPQALAAFQALLEREDATATLILGGLPLGEDPQEAPRRFLDWQFGQLGLKVSSSVYSGSVQALSAGLAASAPLKDVLAGEIVTLDDKATALKLTRQAEDVTATLPHRLFYNLTTFSTYLVYWGGPGGSVLKVELADATGRPAVVRDPLKRTEQASRDFKWDPATKSARMTVPLEERPLLLDFNYGASASYVARTEVSERVLPTVAEIVSRHQQAQTAQDAEVQTYVADARMEQHFRPSATDSGFDVVTENRFYYDREGTEWEELSFMLNGARWGPKRPPFPLLQPEKVLSLPLDLRLDKDYTYRLEGVERVNGFECYAVRFQPIREGRSLYRGMVWIDTSTFLKVKAQTVQTNLAPPVISNEEIQSFSPVGEANGRKLFLFDHLTSRQIMLIAGRNLLVEREVRFSAFRINSPDFVELRASSRTGDGIMYRDTEVGLRHFVKRGGQRVVDDRLTTSAKALAVGMTYDPSFDFPLPMLGINYLDFEFLGKERQLALLFGGVLALANVQQPKLLGKRTDASLDLFAIAIPVNDQVLGAGGESQGERLRNRPFSTGLNMGFQFTDFQKITGAYQFRFDAYSADKLTDPGFTEPVDTVTNGFGLSYEYKRWGYSLGGSAFFHRRASWRAWGGEGDFEERHRSYRKYSVSLSKDFFYQTVHKFHLNAAYFGGENLDRFSMYQFGLFDENRVRGVPSAGIRFAELAMVRGSYSFNLFDQYRLDLFVDQAFGRGRNRQEDWKGITGIGIGVNFRGPWNTMIRGDVGKSFLPQALSGSGSFVGQILVLKPL